MGSSATAQPDTITGAVSLEDAVACAEMPAALGALVRSWMRHLRAENKAPKTLQTYGESLEKFGRFLAASGMPGNPEHITREHVETFMAFLLERHKPATAANRYRAVGTFFKWLVDEGELPASPMAKKPPHVPETPPAVLGEADLRRLQRRAEGRKERSAEEWIVVIRDQVDPEVIAAESARRNLTVEQHLTAWERRRPGPVS